MRTRVGLLLLSLLLLLLGLSVVSCGGQAGDDTRSVIRALPGPLLDRGALWLDGAAGGRGLAQLAGLAADTVRSSVMTSAPRVTVISHNGADDVVSALLAAGYVDLADQPPGWRLLERAEPTEASIGIPAVGVADGLLVGGSVSEVRQVIDHVGTDLVGAPTTVPLELLGGANVALVGRAATPSAGDGAMGSRGSQAYVVSGTPEGAGVIALVVPGATQDDAVGLATRVATASAGDAVLLTSLLTPGAPLTEGDRVVLPIRWLVDPMIALTAGLDQGLAAILDPAP